MLGKIIGSGGVAWLQGRSFIESYTLGASMSCRGTVELILASIGLSEGIISKDTYSILVAMAIITTILSIMLVKQAHPEKFLKQT